MSVVHIRQQVAKKRAQCEQPLIHEQLFTLGSKWPKSMHNVNNLSFMSVVHIRQQVAKKRAQCEQPLIHERCSH